MRRFVSNTFKNFKLDTIYNSAKHTNIAAFPWYTENVSKKFSETKPTNYWKKLFNNSSYFEEIITMHRRFLQSCAINDSEYLTMKCEPVFCKKMIYLVREIMRDGFMFGLTNFNLGGKVELLEASCSKGISISRDKPIPLNPPLKKRHFLIGPEYNAYERYENLSDFLDLETAHYVVKAVVRIECPMKLFVFN